MENGEIMYEAFRDATESTREKGETDETAGWSFSDETIRQHYTGRRNNK